MNGKSKTGVRAKSRTAKRQFWLKDMRLALVRAAVEQQLSARMIAKRFGGAIFDGERVGGALPSGGREGAERGGTDAAFRSSGQQPATSCDPAREGSTVSADQSGACLPGDERSAFCAERYTPAPGALCEAGELDVSDRTGVPGLGVSVGARVCTELWAAGEPQPFSQAVAKLSPPSNPCG